MNQNTNDTRQPEGLAPTTGSVAPRSLTKMRAAQLLPMGICASLTVSVTTFMLWTIGLWWAAIPVGLLALLLWLVQARYAWIIIH